MFKPISDKVSLPDLEKEILAYWKTHRIFEKSVEGRQNAPDYTFYEGPPTANGKPGIHHVFARTIKDLVCRYQTMRGYQVHRKAGWDTHGLPVEIEVKKNIFFLVWTTTPWTLISNVALAVNPDVEYVKVPLPLGEAGRKQRPGEGSTEFLILAKDRLSLMPEGTEIVASMSGRDLIGKEYERWFSFIPVDKRGWYVVGGDFVTTSDGSGIVHMATAYGA